MVKDIPLSEITLRRYEKPYDLSNREIVKKISLSFGLLQPGDSRDVVVDILLSLLESSKQKAFLTQQQIKENVTKIREKNSLELKGLADSNIRRQLKRLRDLMIIEKINNQYRITEFESLTEIFQRIEKFHISQIKERIQEYIQEFEK